jgi:hypothetical protein
MDGLLDKTGTFTAPTPLQLLGGTVSIELPFPNGELNFQSWIRNRRRRAGAWKRYIQAQRVLALHRGAAAPTWHPDSYAQPGESE